MQYAWIDYDCGRWVAFVQEQCESSEGEIVDWIDSGFGEGRIIATGTTPQDLAQWLLDNGYTPIGSETAQLVSSLG